MKKEDFALLIFLCILLDTGLLIISIYYKSIFGIIAFILFFIIINHIYKNYEE